jgi:hypothetical protein
MRSGGLELSPVALSGFAKEAASGAGVVERGVNNQCRFDSFSWKPVMYTTLKLMCRFAGGTAYRTGLRRLSACRCA